MKKNNDQVLTRERKILFAIVLFILAVGFFISYKNLRPDYYQQKTKQKLVKTDPEQSVHAYTDSIKSDPGNAEFYYRRANAYKQIGEFENAYHDILKAIDRAKDSVQNKKYLREKRALEKIIRYIQK